MNQKQRQREQDLRARVSNPAGGPWVGRAIADLEDQVAKQAQLIGKQAAELAQLQQDLGAGVPEPQNQGRKEAPVAKKRVPPKPSPSGPGNLLKD